MHELHPWAGPSLSLVSDGWPSHRRGERGPRLEEKGEICNDHSVMTCCAGWVALRGVREGVPPHLCVQDESSEVPKRIRGRIRIRILNTPSLSMLPNNNSRRSPTLPSAGDSHSRPQQRHLFLLGLPAHSSTAAAQHEHSMSTAAAAAAQQPQHFPDSGAAPRLRQNASSCCAR